MDLDVTASYASVSLNPSLLGRLEYAMMTVTPVVILFLALGQEQLYRGPDFGQGQFRAQISTTTAGTFVDLQYMQRASF
jgi:hypothetical protein